jgi:hypothetical protein
MWWTLAACLTDPLASVGLDPAASVPIEAPPPEPAALEIPTTPPMDGAKITGEGAPSDEGGGGGGAGGGGGGVADGAPPPKPPSEYNPISIPQGPRQSGGVKWEGVSKRGANAPMREANGSAEFERSLGEN